MMPSVNLEIDASEVLDELSISELEYEIKRRITGQSDSPFTPSMNRLDIAQTLDNASRALRQHGRIDLAFRLDEIRCDYYRD